MRNALKARRAANVIMSASLNLINGYTGQFSLGHAGFMAVGAYVGVVVTFISAALASFPEVRMIIYALALILMMFYRPQGLFGYMEITNVGPIKKFLDKVSGTKEVST